jgi:hypothetical protein
MQPSWVQASVAAGCWVAEAAHELYAPGAATHPLFNTPLWMGAARSHRLQREGRARRAFEGETIVVAEGTVPDAPIMRRILQAGGATVLLAETLPAAAGVSLVVVPEGHTLLNHTSNHTLLQQAAQCGIVCVSHTYVLDKLTLQAPPPREEYDVSSFT